MKEIEALFFGDDSIELEPRELFNRQAEQFVDCLDFEDPLYVAVLADRLSVLASMLKDSVKDVVPAMIKSSTDENSNIFHGDVFTLTKKIEYLYPPDSQLAFYKKEQEAISKEIEPIQTKLASVEQAIKTRCKQLVDNGDAIVNNTVWNYSVKKK